ncbi:hypothetical protein IOC57_12375 [Bacillus sp. SD075]|uniref:hypothetical protein n=1 Tax=Bacillus sp. SD075 TaxID=2781732 RepID=UPI001A977F5B|nr:hypothetical protein [Bacillus sp. SD075]MBO0998537.1 hypothetical protein [Bacillus sp. SD075]
MREKEKRIKSNSLIGNVKECLKVVLLKSNKNPSLFCLLIGKAVQWAIFKNLSNKCVEICAKPEYAVKGWNVLY